MSLVIRTFLALILVLSFYSCNEKASDSQSGSIRLLATDAPFDFENVASAKITVGSIRLNDTSGKFTTVLDQEVTLDLLQLRNGLVDTLAELEIPSGTYHEVRLIISEAMVDLKDGRHFDLKIPSAATSGLKIKISPDLVVTSGVSQDVLLDFDLSRSFVLQGTASDIKGFTFRPVIRGTNLSEAGSIMGIVSDMNEDELSGVTITVTKDNEVVTTAITDQEGQFKVLGLTEGTYSVTAEKNGYQSLKNDSISVSAGNEVTTQFILPMVPL